MTKESISHYKKNCKIEMAGKRFNRWTVIKSAENDKYGSVMWVCRCICGTIRIVNGGNLRNGKSKSCGCLRLEIIAKDDQLKTKKLTQKRLKELIYYNPETGVFTWKVSKGTAIKGSIAGSIDNGYRRILIDYNPYREHRLAFLYMEGYFPENEIDHINRRRHDNRWLNLRQVSRQCNARNCNIAINNKSGVTGVYWYKNREKWCAGIRIDGKQITLGYFLNKTEAVRARWESEKKYNFPNCNSTSSAFQYLHS